MFNETTVDIAAPASCVFELVYQPEQMRRWVEGVNELRFVRGAPDTVGSPFTMRVREAGLEWVCEGEVTAFEPERRFALRLKHSKFQVDLDFRLEPLPGAVRLRYTMDTQVDARRFKWLAGLFQSFTQRMLVRQAERLKSLAERLGAAAFA